VLALLSETMKARASHAHKLQDKMLTLSIRRRALHRHGPGLSLA